MRVLLMVVFAAFSIGCAATTATPQPFPVPRDRGSNAPPAAASAAQAPPGSGYEISGTALQFRGTPYRNGGRDPNGFDCSGFVWYVFAQHGLDVPRTVAEQYAVGSSVRLDQLEPGDLVFFSTSAAGASHVGIAIGADSFVHAPSSTGVVRVERISSGYWAPRFVGARRLL